MRFICGYDLMILVHTYIHHLNCTMDGKNDEQSK